MGFRRRPRNVGDNWQFSLRGTNVTDELGLTESNSRIFGTAAGTGGVILARPLEGQRDQLPGEVPVLTDGSPRTRASITMLFHAHRESVARYRHEVSALSDVGAEADDDRRVLAGDGVRHVPWKSRVAPLLPALGGNREDQVACRQSMQGGRAPKPRRP